MSVLSMRRHRKRKLKAEINVVPYIDVMLVLLVIFMVTAPLLTLGVDVDLPRSNAKSVNAKEDPIVVSVYPDGTLALAVKAGDNQAVTAQELEARVRAIVRQKEDVSVFVAIPAVWAYNRFANGVERLAVRYDAFAEEFSSILQRQAHVDE